MKLEVKTSQLPNSGKGLFTKSDIKKGTKIIEYKGEIIDWKEYEKRVERDEDGYLFFINKKHCIDAFNTPQYKARYANDAAGLSRVKGFRNNSVYEIEDNKCYIVATRNIKAGEEIFVSYTKEYWDCIRYNISIGRGKK
ncbi:MAG: SET domain-containing protein [Bacteroidia bacterium]|nr:SET domain-containing protein [Bacteroidia bacterium]